MGVKNRLRGGLQVRIRWVNHGGLFIRFFYVVIIAILMTALFTMLLYSYISRTVFTSIKEAEMLPRAQALAQLVSSRDELSELSDLLRIMDFDDHNSSLLGAYFIITDEAGGIRYQSKASELILEGYPFAGEATRRVVTGENVVTGSLESLSRANIALVSAPIEKNGARTGAVLMFVPMIETIVLMNSLNSTLFMSLLLAVPVVAALVFYMITLIVRPLRQMRDVALYMAGGSFSARADERQRGEIGELARSLNHLSRALKQTLDDLTLERNRLRQMVDGLNEGLVAVDAQNNITHGNPALNALFRGLTGGFLASEKLSLIPVQSVWDDFDAALSSGEGIERQIILTDRVLRMSITTLRDTTGAIVGGVGLFQDITESERLERTRRDYVANVSHEMRTPLTAMRGLIEPLSDGMVANDETKMRYYAILMRETMRLSRLVDDLMVLSRLQSGNIAFDEREFSLAELMEDLLNKYSQPMEEHGLTLKILTDIKTAVRANPDRVEQILVILLDNAMKYTPEGGRVWVDVEEGAEKITLCVRDTGTGIAEEDQPYIFDRFYKVDKAHSGLGAGLGLSIAREMARLMGEDIWVESVLGEGSTFYFTLKRGGEGI